MSLLVPDLRLFIKRCVATHCEDEAVATTPKKKKKKTMATPTKQQLSAEAGALMRAIVSGTASELDFAAGLKFIDQHWKLVFEPRVGVYATELRSAISTAISCRNKVAHQALLGSAMSFDCFDALNDLAVLMCAEKATKRKIRALLSQKSAVGHASTLQGVEIFQKSLDAFTTTQLKQGEEDSERLIRLENLFDNTSYYAKNWLVRSIEDQEQLEDNGTKLEELTQKLAKQTQLVHSLRDQVELLQNSISTNARDRWNTPRTILDDIVLFAERQEENAKFQEDLLRHQEMRLEALTLQTQEDTRALKNQANESLATQKPRLAFSLSEPQPRSRASCEASVRDERLERPAMPIQSHGRSTKPSQHLERSPGKPPSSASSSSTAGQAPPRKLSRAATLRSHWSQCDLKEKSLPAALPSFQDADRSGNFGVIGIAGPQSTATTATDPCCAASPAKPRSRASRATDAISKFLNRQSSDKASKPTTPATSEERRFWPRRLTSEKKVMPESIPIVQVYLETASEENALATGSQPLSGKSDAVRGPQRAGSTGTVTSAIVQARAHPGKPQVSPSTVLSSQASSSVSSSPQPSLSGHRIPVSASGTARVPTPPLEPPFTPQYTLRHFGSELTELEKCEVLQFGDIFFFSSLDIKTQRREGKIHHTAVASTVRAPAPDEGSTPSLPQSAPVELFNDGYDDDRGDYLVLAQDHLAFRFEVLHVLGSGSFGQVVCCWDHQRQQQVAVKIIRNRKKYKEQSLIEVQILSQLQRACHSDDRDSSTSSRHAKRGSRAKTKATTASGSSPQRQTQAARIVKMFEYFVFRNHLCISFELLGINLYEYLKLRFFQGLPMANIRDIGAQLVATLRLLHTQRVIHCDLKPENILIKPTATLSTLSLNRQSESPSDKSLLLLTAQSATTAHANVRVEEICLIDFGSSCLETTAIFTYIQSRFYRSPEVILGFPYSAAIDMWSLGCILVELHTGYPIFAGENESEQLACIMELLGTPSHDLLMHSRRRKHFFTETSNATTSLEIGGGEATKGTNSSEVLAFQPKPFVNSRGRRRTPGSRSLTSAVRSEDQQFVEFVRKCLVLDPRQRMTPEQAERDPWLRASVTLGDDECDDDGDAGPRSMLASEEVTGI